MNIVAMVKLDLQQPIGGMIMKTVNSANQSDRCDLFLTRYDEKVFRFKSIEEGLLFPICNGQDVRIVNNGGFPAILIIKK